VKGSPPIICHRPWTSAFILLDGKVSFCCHLPRPESVIGDLNQNSFEEVWNAPLAQEMRHCMLQGHLPPLCRDCPLAEVRSREAAWLGQRGFDEAPDEHEIPFLLAGEGRFFHLGRGWWNPERCGELPARWTSPVSELYINRDLAVPESETTASGERPGLLLDIHTIRCDDTATTDLRFQWEGQTGSAEVRLKANRQVLVPILPPPPAGENDEPLPGRLLRVQTLNPWIPADCIPDSADQRELGVLVTGMTHPPEDGKPRRSIRRALGRLLGRG
jgi:radical SAM protein with 4Fe4S-binding SPASM domain